MVEGAYLGVGPFWMPWTPLEDLYFDRAVAMKTDFTMQVQVYEYKMVSHHCRFPVEHVELVDSRPAETIASPGEVRR